ncbi:MAG: hypothetical protein VXZ19_06290 [Pseudomonadota bacterium]|nr:hypothetical protein [Pseudomonadota bacterium]MEC8438116.1 hypothetical protein [Pseudomonadota bacterium]MEC8620268.1 hypothetical protein [Pseudomonadota bacterium]
MITADPNLDASDVAQPASNDNAQVLPRLFRAGGWRVRKAQHRAIHRAPAGLACNDEALAQFDLIWPVGFGPHQGFLDWVHLLDDLPPRKLINPPSALVMKHGKAAWIEHSADTYMAAEPERLIATMQENPGEWVLKPMAGSFGEGVIRLASSEHERLRQAMSQQPGAYFVLQRFLPEIAHGETRTIIVGGQIIGSYLRVPANNFHANLAKKALTQRTELSAAQLSLVKTLNADMLDQHIGFAAIDLVGETLMEVNIANPGGIGTLQQLYERDFGIDIINAANAFLDL